MIEQSLPAIITGISTMFAVYIIQNAMLKKGITEWVLSKLNKVSIDKIDLNYHQVYIALKNYKNQINFNLSGGEIKSKFCKEFIGYIFNNMLILLDKINAEYIKLEKDKSSIEHKSTLIDHIIISLIEECKTSIIKDIENNLIIPNEVKFQFESWKIAQIDAFKTDVNNIINDDTHKELYTKIHNVFNKVSSFFSYVMANYVLLFNNINGAFNELTEKDIFKNKVIK